MAPQATQSARERIGEALHHWLAHGESWPPSDASRLRNLLLDASSSDHRALVELLLRVGRHGVADALRELGQCTPAEWASRRAALATRTTGELFIDHEVAAWAVDSWAVALGVIAPETLAAQRAMHTAARVEESTGSLHGTTRGAGRTAARPAAGAARQGAAGVGGTIVTAPAVPGVPSWAGGAQATRIGAIPSSTGGMRVIRGWQGSSGPVPQPNVRLHMSVMAGVAMLVLAVVLLVPRDRARVGLDPMPGAGIADNSALVGDVEPLPPTVAADSFGEQQSTSPPSLPPDVETQPSRLRGALDTIRLTDGRTLIGSIRLVAPTALFVYDVATGLEYTLPFAQVASVVTHTGASLPLPAGVAGDPMALTAALLDRGIGGSYRVEQRVRSVDGNSMCGPVAAALGREVIRSVEEFTHVPGSREFVLASRPGVRGIIDASARFTSVPYTSTRDGVRFTFRMSGHFTPGGFVARTLTETEANIRYRRTQTCRIVADLLGTRTVPAAGNEAAGGAVADDSAAREPAVPSPR